MVTKINQFIHNKLLSEIDKYLAIAALLVSIVLTLLLALTIRKYTEVGITIFLACLVYLLIRRYLKPPIALSLSQLKFSSATHKEFSIIFFALFIFNILTIILRTELYSRPIVYFVSLSLMTVLVAAEILLVPSPRASSNSVLIKIAFIALNLIWIPQIINPGLTGVDVWWHQMFTTQIIESSGIPDGYAYSQLPIMHLIIAISSMVSGLDYKYSTMLSVSFLQLIGLLFVFLLGRQILGRKVGLLATLILAVGVEWIPWGVGVVPTALAAVLVIALVYLVFKPREKHPLIFMSFIIVLLGLLILTHTVTSLCMAILLLVFWFAFKLQKRVFSIQMPSPVSLTLCLICIVAMFAWWTFASGSINSLAGAIRWGFRVDTLTTSTSTVQYTQTVPYSEYLLNLTGFLLFYLFSIIGAFYMLSRKFGNRDSTVLVLGGISLVILGFIGLPLGLSAFLSHRWWFYSYFIMAIPAAIGILSISQWVKNGMVKLSITIVLVLIVSFLSITAPTANKDSPLYSKNSDARAAFSYSQLAAMDTLSSIKTKREIAYGRVGAVTSKSIYYFEYQRSTYVRDIADNLYLKDFSGLDGVLVMIDEEVADGYFEADRGGMKLNYDPRLELERLGFSHVYNCGANNAYFTPPK
jgi:hypothetical protein